MMATGNWNNAFKGRIDRHHRKVGTFIYKVAAKPPDHNPHSHDCNRQVELSYDCAQALPAIENQGRPVAILQGLADL